VYASRAAGSVTPARPNTALRAADGTRGSHSARPPGGAHDATPRRYSARTSPNHDRRFGRPHVSPRRNARATVSARPAARGKTRALGQHFLRDDVVAQRIVGLVAPTRRDLVVEIGPGRGALTGHLARRAGRLLALEVDAGLAAALLDRVPPSPHTEIIEADARRFDFSRLREELPDPEGRVLAVGNLPYSAGKPILMALVEAGRAVEEMALMLQKEVAERVAAVPGSKAYGALSVLTQIACEVTLAFTVPPGAFTPPPRVDSAVIHLRVRTAPPVPIADPRRFGVIVRAAFGQRRKNLANALAAGLALPVDEARRLVDAAGLDSTCRAETLSLSEFASLADSLRGWAPR
jgi:16S rRNA (adenine1518-N6/adenine1519-N6)-dimethyltransferase